MIRLLLSKMENKSLGAGRMEPHSDSLTSLLPPPPRRVPHRGSFRLYHALTDRGGFGTMNVDEIVAFSTTLWRLSDPTTLFAGPPVSRLAGTTICEVFHATITFIYGRWLCLVAELQEEPIRAKTRDFCAAIWHRGELVPRAWGYINGTTRRVAHPLCGQLLVYSG